MTCPEQRVLHAQSTYIGQHENYKRKNDKEIVTFNWKILIKVYSF